MRPWVWIVVALATVASLSTAFLLSCKRTLALKEVVNETSLLIGGQLGARINVPYKMFIPQDPVDAELELLGSAAIDDLSVKVIAPSGNVVHEGPVKRNVRPPLISERKSKNELIILWQRYGASKELGMFTFVLSGRVKAHDATSTGELRPFEPPLKLRRFIAEH
jgi:hypothetical protein